MASSATTRMSHCMAMVRPMPTAWPFSAAITGLRTSHAAGRTGDASKPAPGAAKVSPPPPRSARHAEGTPRAGHDHGANTVVGVARGVGASELVTHAPGEAVEPVGTVEREHRDLALTLDSHVLVGGVLTHA